MKFGRKAAKEDWEKEGKKQVGYADCKRKKILQIKKMGGKDNNRKTLQGSV